MSAPAPDPRRWRALAVLGVAYLMVVLDISVVNVALPSVQREFGVSPATLQWVVSGYALAFGGLLLLGGRIGDLLGRRAVFAAGLVLFSVFSLLCGLSTSAGMLIAFRALQGAAGAILGPSVMSIVSVTFEEGAERNKALGVLGAIAGSGAAIGVLLGGVLTEFAGWEWIFFINVPVGFGALFFVFRLVRESRAHDLARHFDALGAATVTASLMLLVYGLTRSTAVGWGSAEVVGVLAGSAALIAAFLAVESRSPSPLVPLGFFRKRTPAGANLIGFGVGTVVFGMFFLLSLYMQQVLGYSALETGALNLFVAVPSILAAGAAQALATRFGVKPVLVAGLGLVGGGLAYFAGISANGSFASDLLPGFLLVGVGLGFSFVPVSIAALAGVTGQEAGLASGLIATTQQVGGAVGLAILTTVSTTRANDLLGRGVPQPVAATDGFSLAFWVALAFAAVAIAVTLLALRREDLGVAEPALEAAGP